MDKKRILDEEKVKDFVGDFNKFFEDLAKSYKKDAKKIKKPRECFWEKYPEIFNDSSENEAEMDIEVDTKMKTKPPIDREEKLRKVEERLLSNKTYARFTNCDGVMTDNNLSLPQKVIYLQRAIMIRTLIYILSKVISDDLSFYPAKSPFIKEFKFSL